MEMDFDKICRACMCEGQTMFPLFTAQADFPSFSEMMMTITSVRIIKSDGLPYQVCMQCVSSLDSAMNFKALIEKSDSLLRKHVTRRGIAQKVNTEHVKVENYSSDENQYDEDNYDEEYNNISISEPKVELKVEKANLKVDKEKPYSCSVCAKNYVTRRSLKRHMGIHNGDGYKCNRCKRVFSQRNHLKKHLLNVHSVKDIDNVMDSIYVKHVVKYNCEYCGVDAPSKVSMAKHLRACHKDKLPKRKNCALNNDGSGDIEDGERETQGPVSGGGTVATIKEEQGAAGNPSRVVLEVRYNCSPCGVSYENQRSYAAHMTKHSEPVPKGQTEFKCTVCDKVCSNKKNLNRHVLIHSKDKANKCTLCDKAFTRPYQLILHMNVHTGKKRYQCPQCEKDFNMLCSLKDHLRTHSGEKPFLCSICGKGFNQNNNLKQHMMRHSSIKPFPCTTCVARFVSKGELEAHLRKHTGDHPFVCDICSTGFTTSSSLVKHKRIHSGERRYACDFCPQRFTALSTLKNHRRTHTGEKPYACDHCDRAFAQRSDLVSHMRTHTGEKPYVCPTCCASFQQSSALKSHIKSHHLPN